MVDFLDYNSFFQSIGTCERDIRDGMCSAANDIDTMSQSSFNVPLTSKEVNIIALGVSNSINDYFDDLTKDADTRLRAYIDSILSLG